MRVFREYGDEVRILFDRWSSHSNEPEETMHRTQCEETTLVEYVYESRRTNPILVS